MSEREAIERVDEPVTTASLATDLRDLGVEAGDILLVHASLRALGWVCGGPQAVVEALRTVVTTDGTLVVPTHTTQYTDPADWTEPPVPDSWLESIRESRPPYRPAVTPTRGMGAIAECFRTYPDAIRSRHPTYSFAAWGADADSIVGEHEYDFGLGEGSPLARLYERDGAVLLLGVGHEANTSLHLAEHRLEDECETHQRRAPVLENDERVVREYADLEVDDADFPDLGTAFEREVGVEKGPIGAATATLASQPDLVDFGVDWLEANR